MPDVAPPGAGEPAPPTRRKRPWGWIAVAALLAAGLIGLGIYALDLNADLDDADAQIASQQEQIDQAQETGGDVVESAQAAFSDLSAQLGAAQDDANQAVPVGVRLGLQWFDDPRRRRTAVAELPALQPQCAPALG